MAITPLRNVIAVAFSHGEESVGENNVFELPKRTPECHELFAWSEILTVREQS